MQVKILHTQKIENSFAIWKNTLNEDIVKEKIVFILLYEKFEISTPSKSKVYSAYITTKMVAEGIDKNVNDINDEILFKIKNAIHYLSELIIEGESILKYSKEQAIRDERTKNQFLNK